MFPLRRLPFFLLLTINLSALPARESPKQASDRAVERLRGYLQIDTSNPPGREGAGVAYLARFLHERGLRMERYVSPAGRVSLAARLPATGSGAAEAGVVVLLHHVDVVPPGPGWSMPPFEGVLVDDVLWGRGAIDMKSFGIAQLEAFLAAAELPVRRRELLYLAVADEEAGGKEGAEWLLRRHPGLLDRVEAVLNEGGQNRTIRGRTLYWGIEVEQKRPLWLELIARGRGGHGSMATVDSAPHELIRGLARVLESPPRFRVAPAARRLLEQLAPLDPHAARLLEGDRLDALERGRTDLLLPGMAGYFLDTIQITRLEGSERVNVVPSEARAELDIRLLPDSDQSAFLAWLRERLGPAIEIRVLLEHPPVPASPTDTAVYRQLRTVLEKEAPVVPVFIAGITDSRYFRARGIPAYGLQPFELEADLLRTVHSVDERIPLAAFRRGVERFGRLVRTLVAAEEGSAN